MVNTEELVKGDYLNAKNCSDGDIVEVIGEGIIGSIEKNGKSKKVLNLPVSNNGHEFIYTPGFKSLKALQTIFNGVETKAWKGKKFQVQIREIESFGKEQKVIRPVSIQE